MNEFLQRLKQRKLVQWALAYAAAAFALLQGIDIVASRFGWPEQTMRFVIIALSIGLFVTLVLAWYHGDRGAQRINGTELVILALLLAIGGGFLWRFGGSAREPAVTSSAAAAAVPAVSIPDKSIAVLPFVDMSETKNQEYFCDGISEEILDSLAKVEGLRVVARTSSFSFKGKTADVSEIANKLNVENVLEGSLRRAGNRIRITAQLINARTGFHLWSETYERELQDVFVMQDEITRAIVDALKIKLAVMSAPPVSHTPEAHDLYLQGLYLSNRSDEESLRKSLTLFQGAIDKEHGFARAWTGIAKSWLWLTDAYVSPLEGWPHVNEFAANALALDEKDAEAHCYLGEYKRMINHDPAGEEVELRRALQLDPNLAPAHLFMALVKAAQGKLDEGVVEIQKAERLDPLAPVIASFAVGIYRAAGRMDEAINAGKRTLEIDPNYSYFDPALADAYRDKGSFEQAVALYERGQSQTHFPSFGLAITYAHMGRKDEARRIRDQLIERSRRQYVAADSIAAIELALGEKEEAWRWMERAYNEHSVLTCTFLFYPEFRALRPDPRFADLLKRVGFDPAAARMQLKTP